MPRPVSSIEIVAGDTLPIVVTVLDETGAAVDLSGAAARWWLAPALTTPVADVPVKKTLGSGISILGEPAEGRLQIMLAPADTVDLAAGDYVHELEVTTAASLVATVIQGNLRIRAGLVR